MAEAKKQVRSSKPKAVSTKEKQVKEAELVAEAVPATSPPEVKVVIEQEVSSKTTAKAGKRSTKAVKEAEEKQAKEVRKAEKVEGESDKKTKPIAKPLRSKLERASKRYKEAAQLVDKTKSYTLAEALDLAVKTANTKFDGSVEMHINLGVDPKQADQNVRDTVVLPAGTGKKVRIAVLAEVDDAAKAKSAGADIVGVDEIFAKLDKENIDFDILIATPALMPRLGKYARLLGPRGLMPNPKSGTVSPTPATAVEEAKAGRVEYRVDQSGIVHLAIGKASFGPQRLGQNAEAVLLSIRTAKPASLKGVYIKSAYVTSTMGPSIKVDIT
jgi:large subunit ribosomal protein L1